MDLFSVDSLDSALRLLPLLLDLLQDPLTELPRDSHGKHCYAAGGVSGDDGVSKGNIVLIRSASVAIASSFDLLRMFGERIQAMRSSKHSLGVDLSRDERQQR